MESFEVESTIPGNKRTVRVYLPPGYQRGGKDYGLLLAYDGNQYTQAVPTPMILDNMIAAKAISADHCRVHGVARSGRGVSAER